jgi:hypothetical protein
MIEIRTNCCGRTVTVADGSADAHAVADAAGCTCCPQDHHHGQAATESGTACRPLTITLLPGSVSLTPEG